jgi:hypothetical protein
MDPIVNRPSDSSEKAKVGVRREINDNFGPWGNGSGNLDIEHDFAIGSIWVSRWTILPAPYRYGNHLGHGNSQFVEIEVEIARSIAATEFDDPDALACTVGTRGEIVQLSHRVGRVRHTQRMWPSTPELPLASKVRLCRWPIV